MRVLRVVSFAVVFGAVLPVATAHAQDPTVRPQSLENAFPNISFEQPVFLTHAGDGSGRLFVLEQRGRIMVFPSIRDVAEAEVFLDISHQVSTDHFEQGLLGLAFDPDYRENGYFYVHYTTSSPLRSVVSRFQVKTDNANEADAQSELVLLEQPQPLPSHKGGMVSFGPDGYLYVAFGDGGQDGAGGQPNPYGHGQDRSNLLASIIRIDVRGATAERPYVVPTDNPFIGVPGTAPEIWAYGFRNPWRFSFDPAGNLWVGDVGQNAWEEINLVQPGKNYGWGVMEGPECFVARPNCNPDGLEQPLYAYFPYEEGCAVVGGYVYRGFQVSALRGLYLFGDWCSGRVFALRHEPDGTVAVQRLFDWWGDIMISSFGEDEHGELYILDHANGSIYRFAANDPLPLPTPTPVKATPTPVPTSAAPIQETTPGTGAATPAPAPASTATATPASSDTVLEDAIPGGRGSPIWIAIATGIAAGVAAGVFWLVRLR